MSEFELRDKGCCLNIKNLEETMRRIEGSKEFVWVQCHVCGQTFLQSQSKKKRALHGQKV